MGLGFPIQKLVNINFLSPMARPDRHMVFREVWNLFISVGSSPCSPPLSKSSMMCEFLWRWGFRFGIYSSIALFFFVEISICWLSMILWFIW